MVYASLRRKAETVRNVVDAAPPATPAKRKPVPKVTPDAKGVLDTTAAPASGPPPVTPKKKRRIIEESDEEDCEMGETLSAEERSRRAHEAAKRAGDVQDVDDDDGPLECVPVKTAAGRKTYKGRRPGYVFTTRNGVTGYYPDANAPAPAPTPAPAHYGYSLLTGERRTKRVYMYPWFKTLLIGPSPPSAAACRRRAAASPSARRGYSPNTPPGATRRRPPDI